MDVVPLPQVPQQTRSCTRRRVASTLHVQRAPCGKISQPRPSSS